MKNIISIILSGILMILVGCNSENNSLENDLKKDNLKGEVVLVKTTSIDPKNVSSSENFSLKFFNEMGMKTKYFCGQLSNYFSLFESMYNNDRIVLLKSSLNWGFGLKNMEEKYSYNSIGKLESIIDQSMSTKFSYNEDGNLIKEVSSMEGLSSTKEYFYSDGKKDSTFFTLNSQGEITFRSEKFGINNSTVRSFSGEKTLTDIIYLSNNEKGDCVEELHEEYDSKGDKIKTTTTKYEYNHDEIGNWIQKRTIEEGKLKNTEYRTIVYKGGEIGIYVDEMEKVILSLNGSGNQQNSNDNSSSTYSDQSVRSSNNSSSNTYQQSERQKQWVNCPKCHGQGVAICRICGGKGEHKCDNCFNGTINDVVHGGRKTCYVCNGTMRVNCDNCHGKGNTGNCMQCYGRGQVQQ